MKSSGYFTNRKTYIIFGNLFILIAAIFFVITMFHEILGIPLAVRPITVGLIGIFFASLALLAVHLASKKYFPCPYCDKSILAVYDWTCDHCHNKQGKKRHIGEPCAHCKRSLETYVCPFCQEEFKL